MKQILEIVQDDIRFHAQCGFPIELYGADNINKALEPYGTSLERLDVSAGYLIRLAHIEFCKKALKQ